MQSLRDRINRLLRRRATKAGSSAESLPLLLPGRPVLDISDVATVLATLDEQREIPSGVRTIDPLA